MSGQVLLYTPGGEGGGGNRYTLIRRLGGLQSQSRSLQEGKKIYLARAVNRTSDRPARSAVTTPNTISRAPTFRRAFVLVQVTAMYINNEP